MARSKTEEQKLGLEDNVFKTVDGREITLSDHFHAKDFVVDDKTGSFVKHDALLRVCKELFYILERNVNIVQVPDRTNNMCATAIVSYKLQPKSALSGRIFTFQSSADCYYGNHPPHVDRYNTAMAETRASGRALRFLLGVNFCTKEEIAGNPTDNIDADNDPIKPNTIMLIEKKFMGQHGITIEQIREQAKKPELGTLEELTIAEGAKLIQKLNRNLVKLTGG